jgi:dTDP-4-amino-4,6-dideoxygalactose transaminase
MKIPFMRVDRQFSTIREEVMPKVMTVLETGRVLQSPEVTKLEERLAVLHGQKYGVAVNSGTDALILALMGLGLPAGSPVAVTSMSFVASASSIVHAGYRPVFVDVEPETMLMHKGQLLDLVERRAVSAIVAVHLYGQLLDLDQVASAARDRGIAIVEDAAQAIGATRFGKPPGTHADVTCLSFDPTKVIGAAGSGGALVTNREDIAEKARLLRYHGHAGNRVYSFPGYNCQMDSLQAAIIDTKLNHLEEWQTRRIEIANRFREGLAGCSGVRLIETLAGNVHNFHKFVFHAERRDDLVRHLTERGVQTSLHYSLPLHRQPCFASVAEGVSLPNVEKTVETILSLPMYAELTSEEIDHIVSSVVSFY